jgi:hypothetical protein
VHCRRCGQNVAMDEATRAALREFATRALNLSEATGRLRAAVDALEQRRTAASRDDVPDEVGPPSASTRDEAPEASSEPSRDEAPAEVGAPSGTDLGGLRTQSCDIRARVLRVDTTRRR